MPTGILPRGESVWGGCVWVWLMVVVAGTALDRCGAAVVTYSERVVESARGASFLAEVLNCRERITTVPPGTSP